MATESIQTVDNAKRARLLLLATIISISLFFVRASGIVNIESNREIFLLSLGYFLLTYIGLIVAFNFLVNRKSLLLVIPQSSLFVATEVLFVQMFFFREFQRVFDFVFLFILMIVVLIATYAIFLMANVLNVATYKPIPLLQVATTSSYIATVLMVYFVTFAIVSLPVHIGFILITLFLIYTVILIFQFVNVAATGIGAFKGAVVTAFIASVALSSVLIMGPKHELSALIPSAVVFGFIGIQMAESKDQVKQSVLIQYIFVIFGAFLINFIFNTV